MTEFAQTNWVAVMMAVLLLVSFHPIASPGAGYRALRCWVALMASAMAGWLVTPATGQIPIIQYIVIDCAAAVLVLWNPARIEQRRIAMLFAAMIASHIGLAAYRLAWPDIGWSSMVPAAEAIRSLNMYLGWVQLVLLAVWSGGDGGRYIRDWFRHRRAMPYRSHGAPRA
jgi:hypothetical protein